MYKESYSQFWFVILFSSPSKRKMKDYEEEASPFRMYPKDTVHCRGCMCGSRLDIGETSSQIQHTSTHHGSRRHSYEGKELCARNLFGQRRKERLSTPQKNRCSFEETGMADTTPSKFISGALDLLDCDDGSARMWENRIFKEVEDILIFAYRFCHFF